MTLPAAESKIPLSEQELLKRSSRTVFEHATAGRPNTAIAGRLRQAADILAAQEADLYRVAAYRRAADALLNLAGDIAVIFQRGGRKALERIPAVGVSIASAIAEMLTTGRWTFLEHLQGSADPETLFRALPGVGPVLARRICETLHIGTLEALELAACDGRLEGVPGVGRRRAAMVRTSLNEMLGRIRRAPAADQVEPSVELLLDIDREYRRRAAAGDVFKIAPKRFNPTGEAWLPVLHTVRDGWHFTALYSNTARAHQLGRTGDWVVMFFHKEGWPEGQRTVVTETRGGQRGMRVVRGRETECQLDSVAAPIRHSLTSSRGKIAAIRKAR
jgi:hypothetical protein